MTSKHDSRCFVLALTPDAPASTRLPCLPYINVLLSTYCRIRYVSKFTRHRAVLPAIAFLFRKAIAFFAGVVLLSRLVKNFLHLTVGLTTPGERPSFKAIVIGDFITWRGLSISWRNGILLDRKKCEMGANICA